jgi:hypothetical protein
LDKRTIYNTQIKSSRLNFENEEIDACCRALEVADRLKKNAEWRSFKASVKLSLQKPWLWTLKDGGDWTIVNGRV